MSIHRSPGRRWSGLALTAALAALPGCTARSFEQPVVKTAALPPAPPAPVVALADSPVVAPQGKTVIHATGGVSPYTFFPSVGFFASGAGASIDPATGAYVAGTISNVVDQVGVRDSADGGATVTITVGPALSISPSPLSLSPNQSATFNVTGGQPPYCFSVIDEGSCPVPSGPAVCQAAAGATCAPPADGGPSTSCILPNGTFTAGACGGTQQTVTVTDANGATASATVFLGNALSIQVSTSQVVPGGTAQIVAYGGLAPYSFHLAHHGNESFGTLTETGSYTAGPNPDEQDTLEVDDVLGSSMRTTIQVGDPTVQLPVGGNYLVLHGDLNGDGIPDIVTLSLNLGFAGAAIDYGSPLGGLVPPVFVSFTDQIIDGWIADLDGDGVDDLVLSVEPDDVVSSVSLISLRWLRGQRDGTIGFTPDYQFPSDPSAPIYGPPAVVNLRASGSHDFLGTVAEPFEQTAEHQLVLIGAVDGGLTQVAALDLGVGSPADGPDSLRARVRADGTAEVVAIRYASSAGGIAAECPSVRDVGLALVRATVTSDPDGGTFSVTAAPLGCIASATAANSLDADIEDLNSDDLADLWLVGASVSGINTVVTYLRSTPEGGWATPWSGEYPGSLTPVSCSSYKHGDELDLLGLPPGLRLVDMDGGLGPLDQNLPAQLVSVTCADFNGDHLPDFAVVDFSDELKVLAGSIGGNIQTGRNLRLTHLGQGMFSSDFDHDGLDDLATTSDVLQIFESCGQGRVSLEATADPGVTVDQGFASGGQVVALILTASGGTSAWTYSVGDGGVQTTDLGIPAAYQFLPDSPTGAIDAGVWLLTGSDGIGLNINLETVALGGPTGVFVASPLLTLSGFYGMPMGFSSAPGADLAVLSNDANGPNGPDTTLSLYAAVDGGWSANPTTQLVDTSRYSSYGAALSYMGAYGLHPGDPLDQLLVVEQFDPFQLGGCNAEAIYALIDAHGGTLGSLTELPIQTPGCEPVTFQMQTADFDHDGNTDLLVSDEHNLYVFYGDGHGNPTVKTIPIGNPPAAIAVGDFDGDGWTDIAWTRADIPIFQIGLNHHDRTFY